MQLTSENIRTGKIVRLSNNLRRYRYRAKCSKLIYSEEQDVYCWKPEDFTRLLEHWNEGAKINATMWMYEPVDSIGVSIALEEVPQNVHQVTSVVGLTYLQ